MDEMKQQESNLNRREALKALMAAGGALAAAAFVPGKWSKPVVEGGVVPAHAQSTLPEITITVTQATLIAGKKKAAAPAFPLFGRFTYEDPAGLVTNASNVVFYVSPCGDEVYNGPLGNVFLSGNGFAGELFINAAANCDFANIEQLCAQLYVGSRYDDDCLAFTKPT